MISSCICNHEGQDSLHGKGMRVFNETVKGYRCTVCLREKQYGKDAVPSEAMKKVVATRQGGKISEAGLILSPAKRSLPQRGAESQ